MRWNGNSMASSLTAREGFIQAFTISWLIVGWLAHRLVEAVGDISFSFSAGVKSNVSIVLVGFWLARLWCWRAT